MPPSLIVDPSALDLSRVDYDLAAVQEKIPQRFEMAFLDRVHWVDRDACVAVGSKDFGQEEFWSRGHIPGRPILPGVLSVEALAQLSTFYFKHVYPGAPRPPPGGGREGHRRAAPAGGLRRPGLRGREARRGGDHHGDAGVTAILNPTQIGGGGGAYHHGPGG